MRAYAPVLLSCGIDQATFLHFLSSFDRARELMSVVTSHIEVLLPSSFPLTGILFIQVSALFNAMNAAAGLHFVPSIATQAVE